MFSRCYVNSLLLFHFHIRDNNRVVRKLVTLNNWLESAGVGGQIVQCIARARGQASNTVMSVVKRNHPSMINVQEARAQDV